MNRAKNKTKRVGLFFVSLIVLAFMAPAVSAATSYPVVKYGSYSIQGTSSAIKVPFQNWKGLDTYSECSVAVDKVIAYNGKYGGKLDRTKPSLIIELGMHVFLYKEAKNPNTAFSKSCDAVSKSLRPYIIARANPADLDRQGSWVPLGYLIPGNIKSKFNIDKFNFSWFTKNPWA